MDDRPRMSFVAAWVFLVIVVAFGFWVQSRTINRLERDEQVISDLVKHTDATQTRNVEKLCELLVFIDENDRPIIVKTFRDLGYDCNDQMS